MILRLFMTTVKEYKRFTDELPVNHEVVVNDILTNKDYVYENVRLMLLRKYFQKSNTGGDLCIPNVIKRIYAIADSCSYQDHQPCFRYTILVYCLP